VIVISNTSPLVNLAAVGQLQLLQQLYDQVIIPSAVYHEIVVAGAGQPGAKEVKAYDWIKIRQVENRTIVASLQLEIDEGEAEAIALAIELEADLLLLDERRGRAIASSLGLKFIGLLGVLVEAKHQGLITAVRPILDGLITKSGFWIHRSLYDRVLQAVGE
jgi:predicted nucleic acid-binding protein